MMLRAIIVLALLAALIVPVVVAELRRSRPRPAVRRPPQIRPAKPEAAAKPPLRLVVNRNDMDRELAALLARNSRKSSSEADE